MKVITVCNQKGGVGKTTSAVTLAHALALKGKVTWLLDCDPQGQVAVALGRPPGEAMFDLLLGRRPVADLLQESGRPRLYIVPGDKSTQDAQTMLTGRGATVDILARVIRPPRGSAGPDYVVIDTAPSVGLLQAMAIWAADLVVVPCGCDWLSQDGATKALESMAHLAGLGWTGDLLGVLPTFYDDTTRESKAVLEDLQRTLSNERVLAPIHRATILRECVARGKTIWEADPAGRAAQEYAALVWKVAPNGKA